MTTRGGQLWASFAVRGARQCLAPPDGAHTVEGSGEAVGGKDATHVSCPPLSREGGQACPPWLIRGVAREAITKSVLQYLLVSTDVLGAARAAGFVHEGRERDLRNASLQFLIRLG